MGKDNGGNYCVAERPRNPSTEEPEGRFRYLVRDAIGLDPFTRDEKIFEELKRLKALDK
jgi:hypothetical protein